MTLFRIDLDTATTISQLDRLEAAKQGITDVINLLSGIEGGVLDSDVVVRDTPVKAVSSITFAASGQIEDETIVMNGVTFTVKDSGAGANEFDSSGLIATTATNLAASINASVSAGVASCVTAAAALGVVTITADFGGIEGNGFTLAESMTNTTAVDFASGTDGTKKTLSSK